MPSEKVMTCFNQDLFLRRHYFNNNNHPFSKVYPNKPVTENLTLSSMEEFEAMLHLTFVNNFTVSNNSFQSRANPNPILAKPQCPPFKIKFLVFVSYSYCCLTFQTTPFFIQTPL